jgi:hypothetical protein
MEIEKETQQKLTKNKEFNIHSTSICKKIGYL